MRAVDLRFVDSHIDTSTWADVCDLVFPEPIHVRGYLVYENEDWYVVAVAAQPGYSIGRLMIPRGSVTEISFPEEEPLVGARQSAAKDEPQL